MIFFILILFPSVTLADPTTIVAAVATTFGVSTVVAGFITAAGAILIARALTPETGLGLIDRDPRALIQSATEHRKYIYGKVRVGGTVVYKHKKDELEYYVIAVCSHEVEELGDVYINDEVSTDPKFDGFLHIEKVLGSKDQLANVFLNSEIDEWSTRHRLLGIAYLVVRLKPDNNAFPNGIRSITVDVKGKKVYDPRIRKTGWSDNLSLCALDWIKSEYGLNASQDEVNQETFIASANICDELVDGRKRYTCNGLIDAGVAPKEVLKQMLSYHATLSPTSGQYNLFVGAYDAPTRLITEDDLAGNINCTPKQSIKEAFNHVKAIYFDNQSIKKETPPLKSQTYIDEDGEALIAEISLPFTQTPQEAQRIAKIAIEDSRQAMILELTLKITCIDLYVGQFLSVTFPTLGLDNKPFLCKSWSLGQDGVKVTLKETHSSIYDWNDGEFLDYDPAPNTNLPSPYDVGVATNLVVKSGNEQLEIKNDGTIISGMRVEFDKEEYYRCEVSYKKQSATEYNTAPITESNSIYIRDVEDDVFYNVRVRLQNTLGVWSAYTQTVHKVQGKTAKPSDVTGFVVTVMPDGTRVFEWNKVSDLDLSGYRVKYGSGGWDNMTLLYDGVITTNTFESNKLSSGIYTFAVKAVDTSGNESENANFITADIPDPRLGDSILYKSYAGNWTNLPANTFAIDKLYWSGETISELDTQFLTVNGWNTWIPKGGNFVFNTEVFNLTQEVNIFPYISISKEAGETRTNIAFVALRIADVTTNIVDFNPNSSSGSAVGENLRAIVDGDKSTDGNKNYAVHPINCRGKYIKFQLLDDYVRGSFIYYNRVDSGIFTDRVNGSQVKFYKDGAEVFSETVTNAGSEVIIRVPPETVFNSVQIIFPLDGDGSQNFREIEILADKAGVTNTETPKMATSSDGINFTDWVDLSAIKTQYIKFKATFINTRVVSRISVNLTGKSKQRFLEDLDTSKLTYDNGIILPVSGISSITNINVILQNVGGGYSYEVISKSPPKIKIYDASNKESNATIDAIITGF